MAIGISLFIGFVIVLTLGCLVASGRADDRAESQFENFSNLKKELEKDN